MKNDHQTAGRATSPAIKTIQKVSKGLAAVFAVLSLGLLILMAALWIKGRKAPDRTPSVFGLVPLIVHTDSMAPAFQSGDLIVGVRTDSREVRQGDVISFRDPASPSGAIVTHRVAAVLTGADGTVSFRTKGDANGTADAELVPEDALSAVWKGIRLKGFGNVLSFLRTGPGLFVCFIAPLLLFLLPEAVFETLEKRKERPAGMAAAGGETRGQKAAR